MRSFPVLLNLCTGERIYIKHYIGEWSCPMYISYQQWFLEQHNYYRGIVSILNTFSYRIICRIFACLQMNKVYVYNNILRKLKEAFPVPVAACLLGLQVLISSGHGCLFSCECCRSATSWSLVQRRPTARARVCVIVVQVRQYLLHLQM
jgi:hypothetical protein